MSERGEPKRPVTLADIAVQAGVTAMTVSRVLNQSGYVHEETREKVLRVARALNYRRNGLARGLKRQRTDTVGLVLGDIAKGASRVILRRCATTASRSKIASSSAARRARTSRCPATRPSR